MGRALVPVSVIAQDACEEIGDSTEKYHLFMMKVIAEQYKFMNLHLYDALSIKTDILPYGNVIDCPCDFVYETKVGVKVGDRVAVLWRNYDNLNRNQHPTKTDGDYLKYIRGIITGSLVPDDIVPFYNWGGTNVLDGYGIGVDPKGFYRLDRATGTIEIGSFWPKDAEFVLEYKSDGISDGLELAPSEWAESLKFYALHRYYMRKQNLAMSREYEGKYLTQYYSVKDIYLSKPVDYYARIFQNTPRQTINNLM